MIGFVTWPLFSYQIYYKDGQVTKPMILVKICYKLLSLSTLVLGLVRNYIASGKFALSNLTMQSRLTVVSRGAKKKQAYMTNQ